MKKRDLAVWCLPGSIFGRFLGPGREPKMTPGRALENSNFSSIFRFVQESVPRRPDSTLGGPRGPLGGPRETPGVPWGGPGDQFGCKIQGTPDASNLRESCSITGGFTWSQVALLDHERSYLILQWWIHTLIRATEDS